MEGNIEYQEMFERTGFNTLEEAQYKIRSVIEAHPIEYGWVAGEPEIYKDNEGKYGVKIPLVKYSQEQNLGRSR